MQCTCDGGTFRIRVASTFAERCRGLLGQEGGGCGGLRQPDWESAGYGNRCELGQDGIESEDALRADCKADGRNTSQKQMQTEVLCLVPCRSVHTFGMKFAIDVMFVDAGGVVLRSERNVGKGRLLSCHKARFTCEREADPESAWPMAGDRLEMGFATQHYVGVDEDADFKRGAVRP